MYAFDIGALLFSEPLGDVLSTEVSAFSFENNRRVLSNHLLFADA